MLVGAVLEREKRCIAWSACGCSAYVNGFGLFLFVHLLLFYRLTENEVLLLPDFRGVCKKYDYK